MHVWMIEDYTRRCLGSTGIEWIEDKEISEGIYLYRFLYTTYPEHDETA
jgi:hypothetical protein